MRYAASSKFLCLTLLMALSGRAALAVKPKPQAAGLTEALLSNISFRSIGPTRQSGRFVDFAVPLQEPSTFYAATASGGLWKTVNNGQTFTPIFDHEKVFSIGDIAVAPSDPSLVWVGSGEANNSRSTYWGDGVYKSTDSGQTWTHRGLPESHHIGRILIHPANPDIVYVAALGHLYSENPERGLYKTSDGGRTWTKVLDVVAHGTSIGVVDAVLDPENPEVIYAATYDRLRKPWTYMIGGPGSGIHKSTDGGRTWTRLGGGLPGGSLGRIGLAIYAKNPRILYANIENANKPGMTDEQRWQEILAGKDSRGMIDGEVYRSDDAGQTWKKVNPEKTIVGGAPGYYYGQIIIDPSDDKHVYVLSVGVYETRDSGASWNPVAFLRFGGDNHALWIDPRDSNHMLLGYDHGMGVTYDGGKNWYHPDHLPLAQLYAIDADMAFPYNVAGGTQDNGSHYGPSTTRSGEPIRLEDWRTVGGGDGMYNVFDRSTNRYLYNEYQFGTLQRVDLVTGERRNIAYQNTRKDLRWNWCAPVLISPHASDVIYHGANILVRSPYRGETWQEVSPDLTTNDPAKLPNGKGGDGNIQHCTITTIDESPLAQGLLWVGTDDGNVWLTRDSGKNWTKLNDKIPGNPGLWVSRIIASRHREGTAYLAYTGYRQDDFRPYLFKTADFGQTWVSIAGNLPAEPINVVREHHGNPNLLFVGTEFGVYATVDGGARWTKMKAGIPTQPVHDLVIHPRENDLIVGTHGRGFFIADISPLAELTAEVLAKDVHLFAVEPKAGPSGGDDRHSSSVNYEGEVEPAGLIVYYYLKNDSKSEVTVEVWSGDRLINQVKGAMSAGLNKILWDMTVRRELTEAEKKARQDMRSRFSSFMRPGRRLDPNYDYAPAPAGEYRFVLKANGKAYTATGRILSDAGNPR